MDRKNFVKGIDGLEKKKICAAVEQHILSFYSENPFVQELGIEIVAVESGCVSLKLPVLHRHTNVYHIAHGGVLMSLADTAMGAACLSRNKKVVTLDFNMNMIKAVAEGREIHAIGRILHDGARTLVAECDLCDQENKLYGRARATFFVIGDFAAT